MTTVLRQKMVNKYNILKKIRNFKKSRLRKNSQMFLEFVMKINAFKTDI